MGWQGGRWLPRWELGDGGMSSRIFDPAGSQLNSTLLLSTVLSSRAIGSPIWEQVGRLRDNLGLPGNSSSSFLYRVSSCLGKDQLDQDSSSMSSIRQDRLRLEPRKLFNRGVYVLESFCTKDPEQGMILGALLCQPLRQFMKSTGTSS